MPSTIENLLNLKIWMEDEIKNRFASVLRELSIEEDILRSYENKLQEIEEIFENYKEGTLELSKIQDLLVYQDYMINKKEAQKKIIAQKEELVEKIRLELVEATREKRIFQRLLEKEKEKEAKKIQRLEQISSDESASLKYSLNEE